MHNADIYQQIAAPTRCVSSSVVPSHLLPSSTWKVKRCRERGADCVRRAIASGSSVLPVSSVGTPGVRVLLTFEFYGYGHRPAIGPLFSLMMHHVNIAPGKCSHGAEVGRADSRAASGRPESLPSAPVTTVGTAHEASASRRRHFLRFSHFGQCTGLLHSAYCHLPTPKTSNLHFARQRCRRTEKTSSMMPPPKSPNGSSRRQYSARRATESMKLMACRQGCRFLNLQLSLVRTLDIAIGFFVFISNLQYCSNLLFTRLRYSRQPNQDVPAFSSY